MMAREAVDVLGSFAYYDETVGKTGPSQPVPLILH